LSHLVSDSVHLDYNSAELSCSPLIRFFKPDMVLLPLHVGKAFAIGLEATDPPNRFKSTPDLHAKSDCPVETGFTISQDSAFRVFVLTQMPRFTREMWRCFFDCQESVAQRCSLCKPRARFYAAGSDVRSGVKVAISGRGVIANTPIETDWWVHHKRPVQVREGHYQAPIFNSFGPRTDRLGSGRACAFNRRHGEPIVCPLSAGSEPSCRHLAGSFCNFRPFKAGLRVCASLLAKRKNIRKSEC